MRAFTAYNDFAGLYPTSHFSAEAKTLREKSQRELDYFGIRNIKKYKKLNKKTHDGL